MKYYAILDTNVLVFALLKTGSVPGQVLGPKFRFDRRTVRVFMDELKRRGVYADVGPIDEVIPDPKDVVFYAVLMEKRREEDAWLVTGNLRHFPMRTYIVTPREMLDILSES